MKIKFRVSQFFKGHISASHFHCFPERNNRTPNFKTKLIAFSAFIMVVRGCTG